MRTLFTILLICCGITLASGQSAEEEVIRLKQNGISGLELQEGSSLELQEGSSLEQQDGSRLEQNDSPVPPKTKPLSWDIHLGTGFSHMAGYGSGMFAYTAPTLTVPLTKKWSLHGGVMVSHFMPMGSGFQQAGPGFPSTGAGFPSTGEPGMQASFSTVSVFGAASYRMSDRLVLHGAGVKQLATTPLLLPLTPFSPYQSDQLSLGATYKLGNNVTIGASIHMRQGNDYYTSPFYW